MEYRRPDTWTHHECDAFRKVKTNGLNPIPEGSHFSEILSDFPWKVVTCRADGEGGTPKLTMSPLQNRLGMSQTPGTKHLSPQLTRQANTDTSGSILVLGCIL